MQKAKLLIVTSLFCASMVGVSAWVRSSLLADAGAQNFDVESVLPPVINQQTLPGRTFTAQQLAELNGKDGRECYAAVDGTVYAIEQGRLWKNGEHVTSGGQAYCGMDLTEALKRSPHGASKLEGLPKVGTYQP